MAGSALVVDDSATMRHVLGAWLSVLGWDVHTAEDGASALEQLSRVGPALLVTDNSMPGMTGLELVAHVRAGDLPTPRILMVSADATVETMTAALLAGVDEYLTKPVTLDCLSDKLALLDLTA